MTEHVNAVAVERDYSECIKTGRRIWRQIKSDDTQTGAAIPPRNVNMSEGLAAPINDNAITIIVIHANLSSTRVISFCKRQPQLAAFDTTTKTIDARSIPSGTRREWPAKLVRAANIDRKA